MMVLNPVPAFRNEPIDPDIDPLFDEALRGSLTGEPPCNLYEDANSFCVQLAVPGMSVEHIDVQLLEDHILRVKGQCKDPASEGKTWYAREVEEGAFARAFELPSCVNRDDAGGGTRLPYCSVRSRYRSGSLIPINASL
jgi:HSP20 family molecular chaperone IbpA